MINQSVVIQAALGQVACSNKTFAVVSRIAFVGQVVIVIIIVVSDKCVQ